MIVSTVGPLNVDSLKCKIFKRSLCNTNIRINSPLELGTLTLINGPIFPLLELPTYCITLGFGMKDMYESEPKNSYSQKDLNFE